MKSAIDGGFFECAEAYRWASRAAGRSYRRSSVIGPCVFRYTSQRAHSACEREACSSPTQLPFLDTNVRHRFEVKGVDPAGNETVASVEWDQTNTAPVVPSPDVTVEAGEEVVIGLGSTDGDSDPLTYSAAS